MELSQQNQNYLALADRLTAAAHFSKQGRVSRTLSRPAKLILPKLMQMAGRTAEVTAVTFWGEPIRVILPELVSMSIWRYGYFDEDVCRYLLHVLRPGMTFVDIGAHFGFFSRLGSYLVGNQGRVLSFEPTPRTFRQLMRNTEARGNIECLDCAAFSSETQLTLQDFGLEYSAFNSAFGIREDIGGNHRTGQEFQVAARKVDNVLAEKNCDAVHLIKVDAESSELHVLQGLEETLRRHHPQIILETGDFALEGVPKTAQIISWLGEFGYAPHEIGRDGVLRAARTTSFDFVGGNLLFIAESGAVA